MRRRLLSLGAAFGCACAGSHSLPQAAGGVSSSAGASLAFGGSLYLPLVDEGQLAWVDPAAGALHLTQVGAQPTGLAHRGNQLLLSLRGERAILVLEEQGGALEEVDWIETGAEPTALVLHPDGDSIFVALSAEDRIVELDADTHSPLRSLPIGGQPTGLAIHPSGQTLYISTTTQGAAWADLDTDLVMPLPLPTISIDGVEVTERVTGAPALSPAGDRLALPALYQDILRPPRHTDEEAMARDPAVQYEEIGLGLSPNNPGVALYDLDSDGRPAGEAQALYAVGRAQPAADRPPQNVRSALSTLLWSADGAVIFGAMEGSGVVVALASTGGTAPEALGGFVQTSAVFVGTGQIGVNGLSFTREGHLYASHWIDRSLVELPLDDLRAALDVPGDPPLLLGGPPLPFGAPAADAQWEEGRHLFYDAISGVMSTPASGVSCSTCHVNGRTNGANVMERDLIPRQVPSLVGPTSTMAPFTWNNQIATVAEEARITSQIRLGGRGVTDAQLAAVAAYIEAIPDVDHPDRGSNTAAVQRGRTLFYRDDTGCADCHHGPRLTDGQSHDLYGLSNVNTPQLIGVVATAPYLHDGRAPTLRAVLDTTRIGEMGDTSMLSPDELDDMEAFLRSL